jgi:hypothetical protein
MQDPVSGRDYEPSINGIKRWAAHELPHGVPLLYALVGFAVISVLFYSIASVIAWAFGWAFPAWGYVAIAILGIFWAFGGWQHGQEAQNELDLEDTQFKNIDP